MMEGTCELKREMILMKELVGSCVSCGRDLFCIDGFFEGFILDDKNLCINCYEKKKKEPDK